MQDQLRSRSIELEHDRREQVAAEEGLVGGDDAGDDLCAPELQRGSVYGGSPLGAAEARHDDRVDARKPELSHERGGEQGHVGYYTVGSYAFAGGADLKIINPMGREVPDLPHLFEEIFGAR